MAATSAKRWALIILLLAAAGLAVYLGAGPGWGNRQQPGAPEPLADAPPPAVPPPPAATTSAPATAAAPAAPREAFDLGMKLLADGRLIAARELLSTAILDGGLSADLERQACAKLQELADKTIFAPVAMDSDVYSDYYRVRAGDSFQKIERSQSLRVPPELLARINGMVQRPEAAPATRPAGIDWNAEVDASRLHADRNIKVIRGPFHAVVHKGRFIMDVYLQRDGYPRIFVRRFTVGLGRNGSTPQGRWHVRLGQPGRPPTESAPAVPPVSGKLRKARFDPPPNCEIERSLLYGEPRYPFGVKGLFIPLEGDDDNTRRMLNYGIHSTNEPESIGREGSLGCIRLRDDDIEMVYQMLYEKWSTVETRP